MFFFTLDLRHRTNKMTSHKIILNRTMLGIYTITTWNNRKVAYSINHI